MRDDDEVLDPRWPAIEAELRRQPRVDPAALDRVMLEIGAIPMDADTVAIESARAPSRPASGSAIGRTSGSWATRRTISLSPLQAAAAALLLVAGAGWMAQRMGDGDAVVPTPGISGPSPVQTASTANARRPVQFVFVSADARQVSLVGSFNDWDVNATPLKLSQNGMWSVEVPLEPGRHVYSFVVDGQQWVPDSAAPRAPADELGISNSIVFVGQGS